MTLPTIYALAEARLRANEGRYLVAVLPNGTIVPDGNRVALSPEQTGYQFKDGGVISWVPRDECRIQNAAAVRDNTLDLLEELADALNIAGLLRARLDADGATTTQHLNRLAQFRACLHTAAVWLEQLRAELPDHYRRDQYPVRRDEVSGATR